MPNYLITFEGGEGAGKSTLIERIYSTLILQGYPVLCTREPGGTPLSEEIRNILLCSRKDSISYRAELFLFLAARAEHVDKVIQPALEDGKVVLCDRFNESTIAYQGIGRGLGVSLVQDLCAFSSNNLRPMLTFYLDVEPKEGLYRANEAASTKSLKKLDRFETEHMSFHQRVREAFLCLAEENPSYMHVIDAHQTPDKVFQQVLYQVMTKLQYHV